MPQTDSALSAAGKIHLGRVQSHHFTITAAPVPRVQDWINKLEIKGSLRLASRAC